MVSPKDLEVQVSDYLSKRFLAKGVKLGGATLFAEIGIDSMTVVELVMFIEEEFGIAIPADQLTGDNLKSLESLVNCAVSNKI
ncbi:MAG: acyl carrier protein [Bacteroidia bacterium]|jgi:acyl carrier protein